MLSNLIEMRNKECFRASFSFGTVLLLKIGNKMTDNPPRYLSNQELIILGEYQLIISGVWRIEKKGKTYSSWYSGDDEKGIEKLEKSIKILEGKKVIDVEFNSITYDINIYFDNDLILRIFNDSNQIVFNEDYYDVYQFSSKDTLYTISRNGDFSSEKENKIYLKNNY